MKIEFHAIIRQQSESLIITIPKEVAGMLELKSKETRKFIIETDNDKSGDMPSSSRTSTKSPNTHYISDGAVLFQSGYMRKKDIKKILKEEEEKNAARR